MAVKKFIVIYNRQPLVNQLDGSVQQVLTKAQAEAKDRSLGKDEVVFTPPLEEGKIVRITAETEGAAAVAARLLLGATESEGEFLVAEVTNVKSNKGH